MLTELSGENIFLIGTLTALRCVARVFIVGMLTELSGENIFLLGTLSALSECIFLLGALTTLSEDSFLIRSPPCLKSFFFF